MSWIIAHALQLPMMGRVAGVTRQTSRQGQVDYRRQGGYVFRSVGYLFLLATFRKTKAKLPLVKHNCH